MATPTFNLPTSGSDPKRATKESLEDNINQIIQYLDNARISGDTALMAGLEFQGGWDASTGLFPDQDKDGNPLNIGDFFWVEVEGTFGSVTYSVNEPLVAAVDNPSTTNASDWYHAPLDPALVPVVTRIDAMSVPFGTVADFFAASLADIKTAANATTGTVYVETKDGQGRYTVDLTQAASFNHTTTGGVEITVLEGANGYQDRAFGVVYDGATDNLANMTAAVNTAVANEATLNFGSGTACISAAIEVTGKLVMRGHGSEIKSTGTDKTMFYGDGADHIDVEGILFTGNQTGTGGTGATGGNALSFINAEYVRVHGCFFDYLGQSDATASFTSAIRANGSKVIITDNFFGPNSFCRSGTDIAIGTTTDATVTGNVSISEMDAFVSISATTGVADGSDTIRHTVTGNVVRREAEIARSAVLAVYDAQPGFVTVTGNVIEGFVWCGVYISAGVADTTTGDSGGVTVTGNTIRYCGGGSTISASVYATGTAGATVSGNLIYESGNTSAGVSRGTAGPSIGIFQNSEAIAVTGNTINGGNHWGIDIRANGAANLGIKGITVVGNTILDTASGGVRLFSHGNSDPIQAVVVSSNTIINENDVPGVSTENTSSGEFDDIKITNNHVECTHGAATDNGIELANTINSGEVVGNTIVGFKRGVFGISSPQRFFPEKVLVDNNTVRDCDTGVATSSNARVIAFGTRFFNVATPLGASAYNGRSLGADATGNLLVEVMATTAPGFGVWYAGDAQRDLTPSASGKIGSVCVVSGSPGTWKTYGAIDA